MDASSKKFKLLVDLRRDPNFRSIVPDLCLVDQEINLKNKTYILRSSLKNEASEVLSSGKSISIKGIQTQEQLKKAIEALKEQKDLDEIVIQEEINTDHHYTAFISSEWNYCEESFVKNGKKFISSDQFHSGDLKHKKEFSQISTKLKEKGLNDCLVEWGTKGNDYYIFQVVQTQQKSIANNIIRNLYQSSQQWKTRKNFLTLLREEWQAFAFRKSIKRKSNPSLQDAFLNWQFILHYFYIFCVQQKTESNFKSWNSFLRLAYENSILSSPVSDHFRIANGISKKIGLPSPGSFNEVGTPHIFLGKGKWSGAISDCSFVESLEAQDVYSHSLGQIVFTMDSRSLSHGYLAAVENQTQVVGNLDLKTWTFLKKAKNVTINFDSYKIDYE